MENGNGSSSALAGHDPEEYKKKITALFLEHSYVVKRVIVRITHSWEEAEDIVQETFLKVFERFYQYKGESSIRTWIIRIAINEALQRIAKAKRRPFLEAIDDFDQILCTESGMDNVERSLELEAIRRNMDPYEFNLLQLTYIEGLSIEELSLVYDKSIASVKSKTYNTKKRFQKQFRKNGIHP